MKHITTNVVHGDIIRDLSLARQSHLHQTIMCVNADKVKTVTPLIYTLIPLRGALFLPLISIVRTISLLNKISF